MCEGASIWIVVDELRAASLSVCASSVYVCVCVFVRESVRVCCVLMCVSACASFQFDQK